MEAALPMEVVLEPMEQEVLEPSVVQAVQAVDLVAAQHLERSALHAVLDAVVAEMVPCRM